MADTADAVVVYLHGVGEHGGELALLTRYGLPSLIAAGLASSNCPVICPQLEAEGHWDALRVATFVQAVSRAASKTAVIGYSLGASGVCAAIGCFGAICSLAIAIAGQALHAAQSLQSGVVLLAIQGDQNAWADTRPFVESVNAMGGSATSVTLAGSGHYISEEAVLHPVCISMLRSMGIELVACRGPI